MMDGCEVCWVCYRQINIVDDESQMVDVQMGCGHRVCRGCIVPLCASTYLSQTNFITTNDETTSGTKEERGGEVNIECRVCHHITTLSVLDVITDVCDDSCHHHGACSQLGKCVLHPGRPLERFCITDNLLMCLECALEHHRTHELVEITIQAQKTLESQVFSIDEEIHLMEDSTQQIERAIGTITESQRRAKRDIESTFNRLMMELQKKKDTLLANTSKFFESKKRALKLQMKCTQSVVSHLNESLNHCKIARLDQNKASLVALTWTPVVMNHWKWKTVCLSFEAPRHNKTLPLLGAYEGRFYIKQDVTPALKCIKNMSISMIGERQFALQTMRLFVEGEFKQTFDNCLHMFPCSLHGPLCEILSNGEPHVCPIRKTKTCNQSEAVGLVLLFFIAAFRPSLFHSLGPFTILPSEQICGLATMCSPESLVFYELTVESALSLVPQHPPTTAIGKALSNKIWSLFRASPTPSDWKYGVGALAHVMRGYMYATRVGGVIADTRKALVEYDAALSSCLGKTITCIKVPRALAENGISLVAWNIGNLEVSANLGNLRAQLMLGLQRESPENARERVKWIARASEGGDADAQYRMAMVYETGCPEEAGLSKNVAEAMRLYRLAAEQGQYDAQYKVGVFLVDGGGTTSSGVRVETQQYREGVRWLQLAAHQGNVEAMHKLDDLDIHLY